jgi:hypothetical protein
MGIKSCLSCGKPKTPKQSRSQALRNMKDHPMQRRLFEKLTKDELEFLETFVSENEFLNENDYAFKVNRLFLDQKDKPKNHSTIWALALQCRKD